MGIKELGRSTLRCGTVRFLAFAMCFASATVSLAPRAAFAQQKKGRDKVVELNKQALLSYEAKDFETAKDLLTKALKEAKQSGLEDDKMTARTYVHLGAVYFTGFQDQTIALQNFSMAKKIRPDIQLTPSIETPELKAVFDSANPDSDTGAAPAPVPEPVKPTPAVRTPTRTAPPPVASRSSGDDSGEPELPANMPAPLMCTVPEEWAPNKELSIRCALKPGLAAKVVQLHYRAAGSETYQALAMRRTAKGWYLATLAGRVMKVGTLQVYFDARDASDNEVASNGQLDSPSIIEIRKKGSGGAMTKDEDPMKGIRDQAKTDSYEAGLHRRREGAVWIGFGAGGGWGYAPSGALEWEKDITVSPIFTTTGAYHLMPEIGLMWSDTFAIAIQGRFEFIQQQQLANTRTGSPSTMAAAGFLRALWYNDLSDDGNFQFSYGLDLGAGFIRFPVKPVVVYTQDADGTQIVDESRTIEKTDTRPVGLFLLGGNLGLIWHLSRHFALAGEGRFLTGLPNFGAVLEATFSAQLAFGGKSGPAKSGEGDDGEVSSTPGGGPAGNDAPPPADGPNEE